MMMLIDGEFKQETEIRAYIKKLEAEIKELREKETAHIVECGQIAHYSDENAKLKELLRKAVEVINREISSFTTCEECNMYDEETTECNGNAMDKCSEIGKWRYAAEALALIGEDIDVPASADDTNVGGKIDSWISVKDRLPDKFDYVLCYCKTTTGEGNEFMFGAYHNDTWWLKTCRTYATLEQPQMRVMYWMPLPEPPKDGDT